MRLAEIKIYVISSDGGSRYDLYPRLPKKFLITFRPCADDQRVSVNDILMSYQFAVLVQDISVRFQNSLQKRDYAVNDNFQFSLNHFKTIF